MLLAATGSGVYGFSPTRGNGWEASLKALEGKDVTAIATTEGRLLATPRGVGLQESADGGVTWATLIDGVNARCLAFGPDGALYLGADPAAIYKGRMAALPEALEGRRPPGNGFEELAGVRALPSVPTWNFPNQPHLGNIHALAFSPATLRGSSRAVGHLPARPFDELRVRTRGLVTVLTKQCTK